LLTPLTPINNVELGIYKNSLDFVFKNDEIRNIALSGAYGSGKSSILATYEKETKKIFLHISLAHFEQENSNYLIKNEIKKFNTDEQKVSISDSFSVSLLEWKIINQLIHQIKQKNIMYSNFQLKQNTLKSGLIKITMAVIIFIVSLLHILLSSDWNSFYNTLTVEWLKFLLKFTTFPEFRLISLLLCILLAGIGIHTIILFFRNLRS